MGLIPGSGRSPGVGSGNPLQYSCLENSMDRGAWWVTVPGVAKSMGKWAWTPGLKWVLPSWLPLLQLLAEAKAEKCYVISTVATSHHQSSSLSFSWALLRQLRNAWNWAMGMMTYSGEFMKGNPRADHIASFNLFFLPLLPSFSLPLSLLSFLHALPPSFCSSILVYCIFQALLEIDFMTGAFAMYAMLPIVMNTFSHLTPPLFTCIPSILSIIIYARVCFS